MAERSELGVLLDRSLRAVIAGELPILAQHDLDMWGYVVLSVLGRGSVATQTELAAATGRDKTRLIGNLDRLEQSGYIVRTPDPADRRNRVVELTADGTRVLATCRRGIAELEDELLAGATSGDVRAFHRVLRLLAERGSGLPRHPDRGRH